MRHLLLVLMIALLPVRGWMSNAMAVNMAMQQVSVAQNSTKGAMPVSDTNAASATAATMPADCPMSAQNQDEKSAEGKQPGDTASLCNCDSCELCLALATVTLPTLTIAAFTAYAEPPSHGIRFSSAERVFSLKPPIS